MKILVLCYEYPPIGGGGGRAAASVAAELFRRGHSLRVQTAGMRHLPRHEVIDGIEIFRSESFRRHEESCSVPEMALFLATSFLPALRHLRQWKPDVIHAHFAVPTGALAWAARRLTKVPYVMTVQLGDVPGGVPEQTDTLFHLLNPLIRPIWKQAAAVTVVSEFVKNLAVASYGREVVQIANGIDLTGRRAVPVVLGKPLRLIAAGRFHPQKNFPFLIDALALLKEIEWQFDLLGDGPERAAVTARIAAAELTGRVTLHGWRRQDEVDELLARADVLLIPSLAEGLPVIGVQALKQGLAIVGSEVAGLADVIAHGHNGLRLPIETPRAFADGLRPLLADAEGLIAMKRASWDKALDFDLGTIAAQYELVLKEAAQRR